MTLPTWEERKGRASLVPLSKLQLLGVVRTFSATERLGSLQGLQGPITWWNNARWRFVGCPFSVMLVYMALLGLSLCGGSSISISLLCLYLSGSEGDPTLMVEGAELII